MAGTHSNSWPLTRRRERGKGKNRRIGRKRFRSRGDCGNKSYCPETPKVSLKRSSRYERKKHNGRSRKGNIRDKYQVSVLKTNQQQINTTKSKIKLKKETTRMPRESERNMVAKTERCEINDELAVGSGEIAYRQICVQESTTYSLLVQRIWGGGRELLIDDERIVKKRKQRPRRSVRIQEGTPPVREGKLILRPSWPRGRAHLAIGGKSAIGANAITTRTTNRKGEPATELLEHEKGKGDVPTY